jgi:hypothetical protein
MTKQLMSVALSLAVLSQGIARADEPAPKVEITSVRDGAGGAERIAIPRPVMTGLRYQPGVVPQATPMPWKTVAIIFAAIGVGALLTSVLVSRSSRR